MEFGLFTCGYQRRKLEQAFSDASAFGYDYIELWGGRPHAYAPDLVRGDWDLLRALSEEYCVPVRVYTPEHNAYPFNYMIGDVAQWADSIQYLKTAIHASALIGAEAMLVSIGHSGGMNSAQRRERLRASLQELAEEAQKRGQILLLENLTPMESDGYTSLSEYSTLFSGDLPGITAMCDVVVPFVQGENPVDYVRALGDNLGHIHLTDSNGVDESHLLPGDGVMDLKKLLWDLRSTGYDGNVTIELVTNYMKDPTGAAALAIRRIKELI